MFQRWFTYFLRREKPSPAIPRPRSTMVEGSGTAAPLREKAALNVGAGAVLPPTMSVPTRNQSGLDRN